MEVVLFVVGVLVGYFVFRVRLHRTISGTLRIDQSDPDGPYLFLEVRESPTHLIGRKYITLQVNTENYPQD